MNPYAPGGDIKNLEAGGLVSVDVPITDRRGRQQSLDKEGFMLVQHRSEVTDWQDEGQITSVYYPEMIKLAQELTGARKCVIAGHIGRSTDDSKGLRFTAGVIHNDFSDAFGGQFV